MAFNAIHAIKLSSRNNNDDIWVKVIEKDNKIFLDIRQYNQWPTINGVFMDAIEFIWFKNELLNGGQHKVMKMIRDSRTVSIERKDDVTEICMDKVGLAKKGVALFKNEEDILINELQNLAKIMSGHIVINN